MISDVGSTNGNSLPDPWLSNNKYDFFRIVDKVHNSNFTKAYVFLIEIEIWTAEMSDIYRESRQNGLTV